MVILNFSHPITACQQGTIERLTHVDESHIFTITCQFDNSAEFEPQIRHLVNNIPLSSNDWQTKRILINPPGYAPAASVLFAELHGRMGYFPALIRIRASQNSAEPFEIAEIINLQTVRSNARTQRAHS